jgi:hypothetical protein
MDNEFDYIDKLYSEKFDKFEDQTSGSEWDRLDSQLGKSNFLKYGFATFNVFYLAAFLTFAGTATFLGVKSIKQSTEIRKLEHKVEVLQKQVNQNETYPVLADSAATKSQEEKPENKIETKPVEKKETSIAIQNINNSKENLSSNKPTLNLKKDSVYTKLDTSSTIKKEPVKINRVKKTVYIKKDNVIVKDTVRIKKEVK